MKTKALLVIMEISTVDAMVVLTVVLLKGLPNTDDYSYHVNILPVFHPVMNISWLMSILLTVLITLERYYAICWRGVALKKTETIEIATQDKKIWTAEGSICCLTSRDGKN